jgi:hypothetical protein
MPDPSREYECRKCHLVFVPTYTLDFYPDSRGSREGLCEHCRFTEGFTGPKSLYGEPVSIPVDYELTVCKKGQGEATCSYLGLSPESFRCMKGSYLERIIKMRRQEDLMAAKGDNCSGPPDFKYYL